MKAFVRHQYGGPETLSLQEIDLPPVRDREVLIKVHAVSLNPRDRFSMRGIPYMIRPFTGFIRPRQKVLGTDLAGEVVAVGPQVTLFHPGDRVVADAFQTKMGGFAEYTAIRERDVVHLPPEISFADAAAIPTAGLTAFHCFLTKGQLQPGDHILINGASGGVGTYAVQLAKALGAEVTAVCSTRNVALVRSLGADHVIDYTQEDFVQTDIRYDFIMDNVVNRSFREIRSLLRPGGRAFSVGYFNGAKLFQQLAIEPWKNLFRNRKLKSLTWRYQAQHLEDFLPYFTSGKVKSSLDHIAPLDDLVPAMEYLETGRARGKVVVRVVPQTSSIRPQASISSTVSV